MYEASIREKLAAHYPCPAKLTSKFHPQQISSGELKSNVVASNRLAVARCGKKVNPYAICLSDIDLTCYIFD